MEAFTIKKESGSTISCIREVPENPRGIVIAVHGFSSSKTCATYKLLLRRLPEAGYGMIGIELPGHGTEEWLSRLMEGCTNIGRNLNDTRGLFHSFRDCREQMRRIFDDMVEMAGDEEDELEILNGVSTDRVSHYCRVHRPGFPRLACPQTGFLTIAVSTDRDSHVWRVHRPGFLTIPVPSFTEDGRVPLHPPV